MLLGCLAPAPQFCESLRWSMFVGGGDALKREGETPLPEPGLHDTSRGARDSGCLTRQGGASPELLGCSDAPIALASPPQPADEATGQLSQSETV